MSELRDLYEEVILDHNRNPRNFPKRPDDCTHTANGHNPLCGDQVAIHLTLRDGVIADVGFEGEGCAISTASASMMTQALMGKPVEDARVLFSQLHGVLTEKKGAPEAEELGKLAVLGGVKEYPMRVKCATLAWHTMIAALDGDAIASSE
ncbi:MAG: nitrogen fixation NifU-like protein [Gammaproteobacteria bacterium]|jgi:nitrogen fixation NifU-like protein